MRGWWDMACWNGLSPEQQTMLIEHGVLFAGRWEPEGRDVSERRRSRSHDDVGHRAGPAFLLPGVRHRVSGGSVKRDRTILIIVAAAWMIGLVVFALWAALG